MQEMAIHSGGRRGLSYSEADLENSETGLILMQEMAIHSGMGFILSFGGTKSTESHPGIS